MKECLDCKDKKENKYFFKDKNRKDGYSPICKVCSKKRAEKYRRDNLEKLKNKASEYYKNNFEKIKKYKEDNKHLKKEHNKTYYEKNKEKISEYYKEWYEENKESVIRYQSNYIKEKLEIDDLFKFKHNLKTLIRNSINKSKKGYTKKSKTFEILECDYEFFKSYIEAQFTEEMNWDNYGEWHLDHIKPIAVAKSEEEVLQLNHYTNFQPLWAYENLSKSDNLIEKQLRLI